MQETRTALETARLQRLTQSVGGSSATNALLEAHTEQSCTAGAGTTTRGCLGVCPQNILPHKDLTICKCSDKSTMLAAPVGGPHLAVRTATIKCARHPMLVRPCRAQVSHPEAASATSHHRRQSSHCRGEKQHVWHIRTRTWQQNCLVVWPHMSPLGTASRSQAHLRLIAYGFQHPNGCHVDHAAAKAAAARACGLRSLRRWGPEALEANVP